MPGNGDGRSKQCQERPADRAEAALEGLERGGTAAPVSPPHTEGARRLRGVKLREGWARVSACLRACVSACLRRRTSPGRVRVLWCARSAAGGGLWRTAELWKELGPGQVYSFKPSSFVIARKGIAASFRRCRDCQTTPTLAGLKCNPFACVEHLVNHFFYALDHRDDRHDCCP